MSASEKPGVLFLDHSAELGGAELYLIDYVTRYEGRCGIVTFQPGSFRSRLSELGLKIYEIDLGQSVAGVTRESSILRDLQSIPGVLRAVLRLARLARRYDVLFANTQKAFVLGALASVVSRRPLVWNLHDIMSTDHFSSAHIRLTRVIGNVFADRIIANSESTRKAFVDAGGRASKTFVVYNGIDPAPFEAAGRRPADLRLEGPAIGMFSRLAPWKGQHVVIEAVARIPGVHLVLVGDALFQEEERYKRELLDLIDRHKLKDRVHMLGFVRDIPAHVAAVDVVVHASVAPEPFGRVIVEGMMAGKPVIASSAGGAAEIVTHRETGWLTTPGSPDELTGAIAHLISNPAEAEAMATAGRQDALKRFSIETMLRELDGQILGVA